MCLGCAPAAPIEAVVPVVAVAPPSATPAPDPKIPPQEPPAPAMPPPRDDLPVDLTSVDSADAFASLYGSGAAGNTTGGPATSTSQGATTSAQPVPSPGGTPPSPVGHTLASCAFPVEADVDQVDSASVALQVTVDAAGKPTKVLVISDPGHGFGRAARICVLQSKFIPAKDASGTSVSGSTPITVRFAR